MNFIERQASFARELAEINIAAMRQMADVAADGAHRYVELNAQFVNNLSRRRRISEVVASQREYGQSFFTGVRSDLEQTTGVLRSLFSQTTSLLRDSFSTSREHLEASAEAGANFVKDKAEAVKDKAEALQDEVEDAIEEELERVDGIGEVYAAQLREAGILTLAQLAILNVETLDDASHPLADLKSRIESEEWVEQARELIKPL